MCLPSLLAQRNSEFDDECAGANQYRLQTCVAAAAAASTLKAFVKGRGLLLRLHSRRGVFNVVYLNEV